jgi:2-haloacid dehalogenase
VAYRAVLFDLLTGLLDSWTLWDDVAGSAEDGRRWRGRYLELTYAQGAYGPYEVFVADAAADAGLDASLGPALIARWDELAPWPEAAEVLGELSHAHRLGTVTNCSQALGRRAASNVGVPFDVVVTAEEAGAYKPDPVPYRLGLERLGTEAAETVFVAGSPGDVAGATAAGMTVVWHNRIGLEAPAGGPAPGAEIADLRALPDLLDAWAT